MATPSAKLAPLETISYERLLSGSPAEHARLLDAARSLCFFYLDLRGPATSHYLNSVNDLYCASETYFAQPEDVKMADFRGDIEYGYPPNPRPATTLTFNAGYKPSPTDASLELPFDIISAPASRASTPGTVPQQLTRHTGAVHTFTSTSHTITHLVARRLPRPHRAALGRARRPPPQRQRPQARQRAAVPRQQTHGRRLPHAALLPRVGHDDGDWGFIEPREGHAVVNVADLTMGGAGRGGSGARCIGLRSRVVALRGVFVLYFCGPLGQGSLCM